MSAPEDHFDPEPAADQYLADKSGLKLFAQAMQAKLDKKRGEGRGGWHDPARCSVGDLARMLIEHLPKGDPVDIGNFAMMLFNREGGADALRRAAVSAARQLAIYPQAWIR